MFFHHKDPAPRYGSLVFVIAIAALAVLAHYYPTAGLAGLGTVLVLASVLVELNAARIWHDYSKQYKKQSHNAWSDPKPIYYHLNIWLVWPLVFVLGLAAILAAIWLG